MIYPTAKITSRTSLQVHDKAFIGDFCLISVPSLVMEGGAQINAGTHVVGRAPLIMGKHTVIGYNCSILTSSDEAAPRMDDASPEELRKVVTAPVELKDYAYVGSLSVIMPGCVLNEGSLVGAHSYLKPHTVVPSWKVGWGQPFKIIKDRPKI